MLLSRCTQEAAHYAATSKWIALRLRTHTSFPRERGLWQSRWESSHLRKIEEYGGPEEFTLGGATAIQVQ